MTYYLTFGQKYRSQGHPTWKNTPDCTVNPDGWWEVEADSRDIARQKVIDLLGYDFSEIYDFEPMKQLYPLGKIGYIK